MILSDTSIRRPTLTAMVMLALIVFGIVSFRKIGIDLFPRVEFPIITVVSVLPGADPETVETTVTDPIEEAVSTISGIKHLRSTSSDSVSLVVIEFDLEKDVDVAYQEVGSKLGTVRGELPDDLEEPVVEKFDVDASPIMSVIVSGDLGARELTDLADKVIKARLQQVPNVGQVKLVGGQERKIWIWLNRHRLEGHSLTVQDVVQALHAEHVEIPGGRLETGHREFLVTTKAEFEDAPAFAGMLVAYRNGAPVRVRDLGRVEDGLEELRSQTRLDGVRAISLLVRRQSGTNTVEVAHQVKLAVEELRQQLAPQGITLEIARDLSLYIEHSVEEVQFHLLYGGGLAILIVFVFLRDPRSTFISSLVLPVSVISTFILMQSLGFTQNMMTLLALSLAIGLLIDDTIVVQENITRHLEEGKEPHAAAAFGTDEIALAVLATTLSVVAVFVPVAFMEGIVGQFFYQFGFTVAFAVMISMFVSFTLAPMLSARLLRAGKPGRLYRMTEAPFAVLERLYGGLVGVALRWRLLVVLLGLVSLAGALWVATYLRQEFLPTEDQSEINVRVRAPLGSSLVTTDGILEEIRLRLQEQPWLDYTFASIGTDELQRVNEGVLYVKMTPKDSRTISQETAMEWIRTRLADMTDATISVEVVPRVSGGGMRWADVQLDLRGPELERLEDISERMLARMAEAGGYVDLDTTYETGRPEVNVYVKRNRAADLGVSPVAVASTVRALVGGDEVARWRADGDRYDVAVRLEAGERDRPEDLRHLSIRGTGGELIRLENVARVQEESGPVQIQRYGRARQITVLANLVRDEKVLGEAVAELEGFVQEEKLPPGYTSGFVGMADTMREAFGELFFALFLAVICVYMVLASQFESLIHPFTIMLALPLSVVGALGALVATGTTFSIYTMIGIIMLMGLVTKNSILLVDYTGTLRRRDGMERNAAVRQAGMVRLRPILMTTFAIIFGMLPVALGTGAGSESRAPMAVAVIGGLTTSTILTLVVVPVVYTLLDDLGRLLRFRRRG